MVVSRIQIAKDDIVRAFAEGPQVLHTRDLARVFNENHAYWRLAKSMALSAFTKWMLDKTDLRPVKYAFPNDTVVGYMWGKQPLLEVLLSLVDNSYLSHYTAVRIHGLTEQIPKTVYFTRDRNDRSYGGASEGPYEQAALDSAFARPPRASNNVLELPNEGVRVVLLHGAPTAAMGVTAGQVNLGGERDLHLRYTTLERTLIDIVVRPFYAGGVFEVAKAFEHARGRVSTNAMSALLKNLAYGYPYHQAIGYYLERAGYKQSGIDLFAKQPMLRDFYLTHAMGPTTYIERWRLHVPQGFERRD